MPRVKAVPIPANYKLTPEEMETVIQFGKLDTVATIWSSDKTMITKLKKKCKLVQETKFGCRFEIPKNEIKIGITRRTKKSATTETNQ